MVSTFTPNIQLEEPARGDYVGTWDTPVNANMTLLDLVVGGQTTISGAAGSVVLAAAQFQCKTITFNSTLLASITVTFPTSFTKSYEIYHTCTGSSAFVITLQTTVAGGQVVCCPPGEIAEVISDGTNIRFKNFGRIGSYWDHCGSSVPNWVSGCTVPPYLATTGSTFSSVTYPQLAVILGGTTLPDTRGRARFALDAGTGRLSSAAFAAGFNPDTVGNAGGSQLVQSHSHTVFITDPGHTHVAGPADRFTGATAGDHLSGGISSPNGAIAMNTFNTNSNTTGITAASSAFGLGNSGNVPPAYIGGIVMIRAG
jgi:hypothetical protein